MLNWLARYSSILELMNTKGLKDSSILELGSGSHGLGCCFDKPFVGIDTEFIDEISSNMIPVLASANHVPFRDSSFELVLSLDMLEHIPAGERSSAIDEMLRVASRFGLLGFPTGEAAEQAEKELFAWFEHYAGGAPQWLREHLENGLPSRDEIEKYLNEIPDVRYEVYGSENIAFHMVTIIADVTNTVSSRLWPSIAECPTDWIELLRKANFGTVYRSIYLIEKANSFPAGRGKISRSKVLAMLVCPRCGEELIFDDFSKEIRCKVCSSSYHFDERNIPDMRCD